jgi:hypothetical protein
MVVCQCGCGCEWDFEGLWMVVIVCCAVVHGFCKR